MSNKTSKNPVIGIIGGTGRFGGWFRNFFEGQGLEVLVAGRKTKLTPNELAKRADIVVVSVPITATAKIIKEIRDQVRNDALLCDLTSVKTMPLKEMMKTKSRCGVTGIHPLFGPLVPSINKQSVVFCSGRDNHWTKYLKDLFEKNGAEIINTDHKNHDRQMAVTQALTHFINITYARVIQKQKLKIQNAYTTPVFRLQSILAGRVLGGSADLYSDIELENENFSKVVKDFEKEVSKFASYVLKKDKRSFIRDFEESSNFMKHFIPIAQAKAVEIISLMDRQPVEIKRSLGTIKLKNLAGKVAFLGPEGTFSHEATRNIFPEKFSLAPAPTISCVFDGVANENAIFGVVPAENSTEGIVQETLDNLIRFPLRVVGSYKLPIHLFLLARTNNLQDIKIIKSHPQPIAQSRNWLSQHFPGIKIEMEQSSTKAILSTKDPRVAFVASRQAAKQYGLKIIAKNIEDKKTNTTQFYVIAKKESPEMNAALKASRTLVILAVYDRPGVLRDILNEFSSRKLNLTKLHSKTSEAEGWDYYFFIELAGLPKDKKIKEALKGAKQFCSIVRVLGVA